jgi:sugar/nucleoside kinase (ribokinase family)
VNQHPPIDYLVVGHLSEDQTPAGPRLGGTVAYSGLTAASIGRSVGIVTSAADSLDLSDLSHIPIQRRRTAESTSFENRYSAEGRTQILLGRADDLSLEDVPVAWRQSEIVHLAPIAREIGIELAQAFPNSFVGLTPQGLMRNWDDSGRVFPGIWESAQQFLPLADAVVLSIEDLGMQWPAAEAMESHCKVLVVTEGPRGARVFAEDQWTLQPAPPGTEIDPTGVGDIFAAVFFSEYHRTGDPRAAAAISNRIASASVSRRGLDSAPTAHEVRAALNPVGD